MERKRASDFPPEVLKDAGVVGDQAQGTRRLYHLQADTLGEVRAYIDALSIPYSGRTHTRPSRRVGRPAKRGG